MTRKQLLQVAKLFGIVLSMTTTAARRAIQIGAAKMRGLAALGREIGVTGQAISQWEARGVVPPKRVAKLAEISGVPCHEIRPDVFPPPAVENRV